MQLANNIRFEEYMIKTIIKEIIEVLEDTGEDNWKRTFQHYLKDYDRIELDSLKRSIIRIYGGMGSFSDLVLSKNGKICIKENNTLDKLRAKLFKEATNFGKSF